MLVPAWSSAARLDEEVEAVHAGHLVVAEDDRHLAAVEQLQSLGPRAGLQELHPGQEVGEGEVQGVEDVGLVVDGQDDGPAFGDLADGGLPCDPLGGG